MPFSWPERLPVPAAVSNVSQNAGVPPSCILQALADGVGVGVGSGVDPALDADAEQLKLVPPFEPPQLHVHGPEPATLDDVPFEHKLAEGAEDACVPFADPHAPATGAGAALTATVVLAAEDRPLEPIQVSV